MATYHVDLVNGDDAKDGLSWANAWLNVSGHESVLTLGDNMKVAKTPDGSYLCEADYVNDTKSITLKTTQTKLIENAIGATWSASANVTGTQTSGAPNGLYGQALNILAAFTTGKLGYKTISEINLSDYSKVCFALQASNLTYFNTAELLLCLCSDTDGNSVVNSIPLKDLLTVTGIWQHNFINYGSALGSSIKSVAIYQTVDSAAFNVSISNIFATKGIAPNNVFSRKNDSDALWFAINSIVDDVVSFDGELYTETDETDSFFYRETLKLKTSSSSSSDTILKVAKNFNSSNWFVVEGGYNIVSDEVDGETWIANPLHQKGTGMGGTGTGYQDWRNFGFCQYYYNYYAVTNSHLAKNIFVAGAGGNNMQLNAYSYINNLKSTGGSIGIASGLGYVFLDNVIIAGSKSYPISFTNSGGFIRLRNIKVMNCGNYVNIVGNGNRHENITIINSQSGGIAFADGGNSIIDGLYLLSANTRFKSNYSKLRNVDLAQLDSSCKGGALYNKSTNEKVGIVNCLAGQIPMGAHWTDEYNPLGKEGCWYYYYGSVDLFATYGFDLETDRIDVAQFLVEKNKTYKISVVAARGNILFNPIFILESLIPNLLYSENQILISEKPFTFVSIDLFTITPEEDGVILLTTKSDRSPTARYFYVSEANIELL